VVVANRLRRRIVRNEFEVGQPLPNETELMAMFEVSRPVIREGLRILESESLIGVKRGPGGGARVRRPDIAVAARYTALLLQLEGTTVADLFEARGLLEPAAVRRLATLRPPDAIERLKSRHQEEIAVAADLDAFALSATAFHEDIMELAGNNTMAVLGRLILQVVEIHNRAMFTLLNSEGEKVAHDATDTWHAPLIAMIEAGEVEAAAAHWEEHLHQAAQMTLRRLGDITLVDLLDFTDW
jgi:DNA-binding FadR family transcriptional regulator